MKDIFESPNHSEFSNDFIRLSSTEKLIINEYSYILGEYITSNHIETIHLFFDDFYKSLESNKLFDDIKLINATTIAKISSLLSSELNKEYYFEIYSAVGEDIGISIMQKKDVHNCINTSSSLFYYFISLSIHKAKISEILDFEDIDRVIKIVTAKTFELLIFLD